MERFLFAPIGIAAGLIAGLISKQVFERLWSRVSDQEPPEPGQQEAPWPLLAVSLALEGAVFQLTRGFVDRGARAGFHRLTGTWPGERRPEPS